jgi:hypothetical protein
LRPRLSCTSFLTGQAGDRVEFVDYRIIDEHLVREPWQAPILLVTSKANKRGRRRGTQVRGRGAKVRRIRRLTECARRTGLLSGGFFPPFSLKPLAKVDAVLFTLLLTVKSLAGSGLAPRLRRDPRFDSRSSSRALAAWMAWSTSKVIDIIEITPRNGLSVSTTRDQERSRLADLFSFDPRSVCRLGYPVFPRARAPMFRSNLVG